MLKLISSNPKPSTELYAQPQKHIQPHVQVPFVSEVLLQGRNLYVIRAQDSSHYLECDLTLEVEEGQHENESNLVICHFPKIEDEQMDNFINKDDTLYNIIMIQFQMKLLKQLLAFCSTHYAATLIIYTDDTQNDTLRMYQEALISENQTLPQNGKQMEIKISLNQNTIDTWTHFMNQVTLEFKQTLWQNQRVNPAIQQYLKSHPFGQDT